MLFEADYAKNYASIMYQCLVTVLVFAPRTKLSSDTVAKRPGKGDHKQSGSVQDRCIGLAIMQSVEL